MRQWVVLLLVLTLIAVSGRLAPSQEGVQEEKPEAVSLLGEELYATPAEPEEVKRMWESAKRAREELRQNPDDIDVLLQFGQKIFDLWRFNEALKVYSDAVKIAPDNYLPYQRRGRCYLSLRKFGAAIKEFDAAKELMPSYFDNWYYLGLAFYFYGDLKAAETAFRRGIQHGEVDDYTVAGSFWLYHCFRRQGKENEAAGVLDHIREGMMLEQHLIEADILLFYKGEKSEEELVSRAEEWELYEPLVYYGLGRWSLYNGDAAKADDYFTKARDNNLWPHLGYIAAEVELAGRQQ